MAQLPSTTMEIQQQQDRVSSATTSAVKNVVGGSLDEDTTTVGERRNQVAQVNPSTGLAEQHEEDERRARVEETWKKMNRGLPVQVPKASVNKKSNTMNTKTNKAIPDWMVTLGLAPKRKSDNPGLLEKMTRPIQNGTSEDAKRLAAAALSAVKDISSASVAGRGKVEITEVRDFAGKEIEMKRLVDADSKEAAEAKGQGGSTSALDTILEQIKKKQKLSVLDKTKKDWGEFKEENKGMEEELDAYKKSSNQYLDKVSFLERTDHREFERERDARLSMQSKRRSEMKEDDF